MTVTARQVPLLRLDNADPALVDELLAVVRTVAERAAFTLGDEVAGFEAEWAAYCGTAEAIGVASGTDALALALRAARVGPGDEVVVPANSFIATAEAVSLAGARPRVADVDPASGLLTADGVAAACAASDRVRAVIPVHLFGAVADVAAIAAVAHAAGAIVVEDCAQAHGAFRDGRRAGALGDLGAFSFYPTKNLGAWGDAGAVVTDDPELADRVRLLRSHGERTRYEHLVPGATARLDALQAAILRPKLARLDAVNDRRRMLAAQLRAALAGAPVHMPGPDGDHVHHLFVVRTDHRDALRAHLAAHGVASAVHYPVPIHRTPAYADLGLGPGSLPVAEDLAARICTLPFWPGMSDEDVDHVAAAVRSFDPLGAR